MSGSTAVTKLAQARAAALAAVVASNNAQAAVAAGAAAAAAAAAAAKLEQELSVRASVQSMLSAGLTGAAAVTALQVNMCWVVY